jgi:hypothetical protein
VALVEAVLDKRRQVRPVVLQQVDKVITAVLTQLQQLLALEAEAVPVP